MIKRLIDIVLFTSLFIAFASTALVYRTFYIFDLKVNNSFVVFAFVSTLFTYNLTKIVPIYNISMIDKYAYNRRNQWNINHKILVLILTILPALVGVFLFLKFSFNQQVYIAHLGIISVLYTLPVFKGKTLRDFPFIKIFLIAYVWASTAILPLLEIGINGKILLFFIENFLFIFAIALPFDIRDFTRDKSQNIKTIPQSIGLKNTKLLASTLILVTNILFYILVNNYILNIYNFVLSLLVITLIWFSDQKKGEYYYLGLVDGVIFLKLLIFLI